MEKMVDFYDIYDYYYIPFWQTTWFKIILGITLITLLTIIIIFLFLHKKRKIIEPWEWAHQEIRKLAPEKYTSKEAYKKFYFQLTNIIKNYLHKRYGWNIHDKTDEELALWLETQKSDPDIITSLKKIGASSLEVKFANMQALRSQAEADRDAVVMIIEKTTPARPHKIK